MDALTGSLNNLIRSKPADLIHVFIASFCITLKYAGTVTITLYESPKRFTSLFINCFR